MGGRRNSISNLAGKGIILIIICFVAATLLVGTSSTLRDGHDHDDDDEEQLTVAVLRIAAGSAPCREHYEVGEGELLHTIRNAECGRLLILEEKQDDVEDVGDVQRVILELNHGEVYTDDLQDEQFVLDFEL